MKETLTDIANDIISCANARAGTGIYPYWRVHCLRDGQDKVYWLTNGPVSLYNYPELKKFGNFVPKNRDVAIKIQTTEIGSSFECPYHYLKRTLNCTVYLENRSNLQDHTIAIAGDSLVYQYRDIHEFLEALQQNQEDIMNVESKIQELYQLIEELKEQKDTAHQRGQITKTIKEYQKKYRILTQQQEDLKNITIYIRKQDEMRYSFVVDPKQTRIKTKYLFDGKTLIIDGGPGTGKSTTMIHRLAYLTDIGAIDEDEKEGLSRFQLKPLQRNQLRKAIELQRDWMFFSPSRLLKEYLAEAMKKEGLTNISQKVWYWKDYRELILQQDYHLLGTDTSNAPFRVSHLTGTLFYQNSGIVKEFSDFYLGQLRAIKAKLPKLEAEGEVYAWTAISKKIEERFEQSETYSLVQFASLFNSLESVYGNDCKNLFREKNAAIRDLAYEVWVLLERNENVRTTIKDILDLTSESGDSVDDDDEVEEAEEDKGNDEVTEKPTNRILSWMKSFGSNKSMEDKHDNDDMLANEIQKWLKVYCNSRINHDMQLSDQHELISEELLPIMGDSYDRQIKKICELTVFEQFAQYTRGIKAIMLNGLPARYKKFRTHLIKTQFEGCNIKLLREIMQRKQGKELHHQEQSLLLGFINTLVKQILSANNTNIKHTFIDAYNEVSRPIIGVDEATDFCTCDIYAMQSLLTREIYSLTLCGDKMQRLTPYGIKSWEELNDIVPCPKEERIETSYRQSKKLLEVARQLYKDTTGETPNYKAYMESNKVPVPLAFVSGNEMSKVEWISKRISEVFRAYGELLPSIAIFVNDIGYVPRFVERLQETKFFSKNGIKVVDGTSEAKRTSDAHICVYPIDVVKGMEFDVVFFHNIDNASDMDMLKRFIYVGISRAAFFLGITMNKDNPEISKYFDKKKDWFKI